MTGKELLLRILSDGKPHSIKEIESRSSERITVHSRVADLRKEGYVIFAVRLGRVCGYILKGREEGAVRVKEKEVAPVQGYVFSTDAEDSRNGNVCKILARASSDNENLENGPGFIVQFGDGSTDVAYSSELSPWYPV